MSQAPKYRTCPICGKRYRYTNYMSRHRITATDGRWLRDTHVIACAKKVGLYRG